VRRETGNEQVTPLDRCRASEPIVVSFADVV